jgi:hypothetical protein
MYGNYEMSRLINQNTGNMQNTQNINPSNFEAMYNANPNLFYQYANPQYQNMNDPNFGNYYQQDPSSKPIPQLDANQFNENDEKLLAQTNLKVDQNNLSQQNPENVIERTDNNQMNPPQNQPQPQSKTLLLDKPKPKENLIQKEFKHIFDRKNDVNSNRFRRRLMHLLFYCIVQVILILQIEWYIAITKSLFQRMLWRNDRIE